LSGALILTSLRLLQTTVSSSLIVIPGKNPVAGGGVKCFCRDAQTFGIIGIADTVEFLVSLSSPFDFKKVILGTITKLLFSKPRGSGTFFTDL
jgi:hypothetical protein